MSRFFERDPGYLIRAFNAFFETDFPWALPQFLQWTAPLALNTREAVAFHGRTRIDSSRRRRFLFVIKDSCGTKKGNVRKCLRKISQLSFLMRIVLLGEETQVVSHIKQTPEQFARFVLSTEEVPAS